MTSSPYPSAPSTTSILYEVKDKYDSTDKGPLDADVTADPVLKDDINAGWAELQLTVSKPYRDISNLTPLDVLEITLPGAPDPIARWKYLKHSGTEHDTFEWKLHFIPMQSEITETEYQANWTNSPSQDGLPVLGPTTFDTPVVAALAGTKHCSPSYIASDGVAYESYYPSRTGHVIDTILRALELGGDDWWWYCDGNGRVTVQHDPIAAYSLDATADIMYADPSGTFEHWANKIRVIGGNAKTTWTDPITGLTIDAMMPIEATVTLDDFDPTNDFVTSRVGTKLAPNYRSVGLQTVAQATQAGQNILRRLCRWQDEWTIVVRPGYGLIQPGSHVSCTALGISNYWVTSRQILDPSMAAFGTPRQLLTVASHVVHI